MDKGGNVHFPDKRGHHVLRSRRKGQDPWLLCRSVRRQAEAGLPVILYSHPQHFGLLAEETFPRLAEAVRALPFWHATMGELDAWWQKRDGADYAAFWEDSLTVTGDLPEKVSIRVIEPKGE